MPCYMNCYFMLMLMLNVGHISLGRGKLADSPWSIVLLRLDYYGFGFNATYAHIMLVI